MTTRPRTLLFFEALLAGAGAAAALHALCFPGLAGFSWLDGKLIVLLFNDLGAALLLGILWTVLPRLAPRDPAAGFWAGFGLGLAPLVVSWGFSLLPGVGSPNRNGLLLEIVPPVLGIPLAVLLVRSFPRRIPLAPPAGVREGIALFALGLELVLFLGVGVVPRHQVFDPLPPAPSGLAAPESGPDVVLISIDTLRADALSDGRIALPSVERLRSRGMAAGFGLAPAPLTLPSHATMLSGISPFHHGADTNMSAVPGDLPMLAEQFQRHGWRTAAVVSNGVLRSNNGFGRGFESFTNLGRRPEALSVPRHRVVRVVARFGTWAGWLLPDA
ncbi:MAG: sulfatase-like hydrolase/transferase, partial [Planctomycetota bacterium]